MSEGVDTPTVEHLEQNNRHPVAMVSDVQAQLEEVTAERDALRNRLRCAADAPDVWRRAIEALWSALPSDATRRVASNSRCWRPRSATSSAARSAWRQRPREWLAPPGRALIEGDTIETEIEDEDNDPLY